MCQSCKNKRNAYTRNAYKTNPSYRISTYKNGATRRGLVWDLTDTHAKQLFKQPCALCGGPGHGIDRIDSTVGYIVDNVQPACSACNMMKSNHTDQEFIDHCKRVADFNR